MKILMVDDEERFLHSTQKLLKRKGFDVTTASNGEKCLDVLKEDNINVVILDIKMPGIGGMETLKLIKRHFPTVEVIMLTGHGTGEYGVDALMWGAANFLIKPVSVQDMIDKIEEAAARRLVLEDKIRIAKAIKEDRLSDPEQPIISEDREE